ncbi:MAG: hypothetical protein RL216_1918 [Pseudomonadota bacterium]|jgi:hypothetical protein
MMDLAKPDQFDLDRLAEELGALPDAPLAMPVQRVETPPQPGGFWALLRPRFGRMGKAGH